MHVEITRPFSRETARPRKGVRDHDIYGFGVRVHPSGTGGRKAPNKRVVVGRVGRVTLDQARRLVQERLGRVAAGDDPAGERA